MKIRTDHVTNSSSSSFILMGKKLNSLDDIMNAEYPVAIGTHMNEGLCVFDVLPEMISHVAAHLDHFTVVERMWSGSGDGVLDITLPKGTTYVSGEMDHHGPETVEDLLEYIRHYITGDEENG